VDLLVGLLGVPSLVLLAALLLEGATRSMGRIVGWSRRTGTAGARVAGPWRAPARRGSGGAASGRRTRRHFQRASAGGMLSIAAASRAAEGGAAVLHRPIPRSGEPLPVVGLGTWQTFDVGSAPAARAPLAEVLRRFLAAGGRAIDTSPMYGRAEQVVGDLLAESGAASRVAASGAPVPAPPGGRAPFLATKVWTTGRGAGEAQARESMRRMRASTLDLLQVHNLLDWETHLPMLRTWKEHGRIRYLGVTHYALAAFPQLERLLRGERLDFVQLPYSAATREAEKRLLPAAADAGAAVLVMRPFEEGALLRAVRGRPVPAWAADVGAASWAQLFLKFVLSHPAVTCAIPATSKPDHLTDNLAAGTGPLLDERQRRRLVDEIRR
jgi:aryl-alcohol dehydrogenase-like predicted oxidoreductase